MGFSSHTPKVAHKLLDEGVMDMMMFSINPAYDLECGDEYGLGTRALTKNQCIRYCLDRPAVLAVVPGVRNLEDLNELLKFPESTPVQQDYSEISEYTPESAVGSCVYCNHCLPCPAGIDIGLVNKYYDLSLAGDKMAAGHYEKLAVKADACLGCGHCDRRCPFKVKQREKMQEIARYFKGN